MEFMSLVEFSQGLGDLRNHEGRKGESERFFGANLLEGGEQLLSVWKSPMTTDSIERRQSKSFRRGTFSCVHTIIELPPSLSDLTPHHQIYE